jgi:hypothetical protein
MLAARAWPLAGSGIRDAGSEKLKLKAETENRKLKAGSRKLEAGNNCRLPLAAD